MAAGNVASERPPGAGEVCRGKERGWGRIAGSEPGHSCRDHELSAEWRHGPEVGDQSVIKHPMRQCETKVSSESV